MSNRVPPPRDSTSATSLAPAIPLPITTRRSLLIGFNVRYALNPDRAHLEFRHAAYRVERVICHAVRGRLTWPVKRHEDGVGTNVGGDAARERRRPSACA